MSKILFIFLFFFASICAAIPTISSFNYKTDMPAVEKLIKKEWSALFWLPRYDHEIVYTMFKYQKPGDLTARDKNLSISVLKDDGSIIGFITYYQADYATGHIELLAVDSEYKGLGYGKKLVHYVQNWFANLRCKNLQLYVYTNNNSAIQFYHHLGFSIKKTFYAHLLFSKPIG